LSSFVPLSYFHVHQAPGAPPMEKSKDTKWNVTEKIFGLIFFIKRETEYSASRFFYNFAIIFMSLVTDE
jgi:hypothetical protein